MSDAISVSEAVAEGSGATIYNVQGELGFVGDRKKGKKGPYQFIALTDGVENLGVMLFGHPEITRQMKGKVISIFSDEGMEIGEFNGKLNIAASSKCEVQGIQGAQRPSQQSRPAQGARSAPRQQNLPISQPGANTAPSDVAGVKRFLAKMANAMILGLDAACYVADHAKGRGVEFSNEDIRCLMTSAVIELNKRGYVDVLPVGPMDKPKPKPAPVPVPEPEPDEGPSFEEMVPPDEDRPF